MAQVKATDVVSLKKILREKSPDAESQVIARLDPVAADVYEHAISTQWISHIQESEIFRAATLVLFPGSPTGMYELGRMLAQKTMSSVYKVFLRIPSIDFVISRVAQLWTMNFKTGKAEAIKTGEKSAVMRVTDLPDLLQSQAAEIAGYICGVLEMTKAKNPRVIFCGDNPKQWEWQITWE